MPAPVTAASQARPGIWPARLSAGAVPAAVQAEGEAPRPASWIKVQTFPSDRAAGADRISPGGHVRESSP